MTEEEYFKLTGKKLKPVKSIEKVLIDTAIKEVNKKQNKYWAKKTDVHNITFHSEKEAIRYTDLILLQKAWKISDLELQPKFLLQDSFKYDWITEKSISYISDFKYLENKERVIEDVKWMKTDVYKIKRKLFLKKYWDIYKFIET